MINKFMQDPQTNSLAVIVLATLIVSWITSVVLTLRDTPIRTSKSGYAKLLLVSPLLAVPAMYDILQTNGIAFIFAVIAFFALVLNIVIPIMQATRKTSHFLVRDWFKWSIPVLVIGGLAVAGYFTFIESTRTQVICGPSTPKCWDVQNSKYAIVFGIIPMGMFGLAGYIAIIAGWLLWQYGPISLKKPSALSIWGFCMFGVLFSIYLTFLEPFVIGATCMWCITSAVFMIILLLVSTPAAQQALAINDE
jgi:uncharacterized membrane protein